MILVRKWDNLKSTVANEMMAGKFPDCGVKYTGKYGPGLVLVKYDVSDKNMIMQKARAANSEISHVFIIPRSIEKAAGI